jgi:hypothetical protein
VRLYEPLVRASDTAVRRGLMASGEAIPHFLKLADAYAALGRRDRAAATLRDAIRLHPEFADAGEVRILELRRRR